MEPFTPIPNPVDPLVGSRVGSYVIEQLLGQGGMGSVYAGVQPEIGKRVAVKFLADEFNANANVVNRFFQEARAVNVIGHENIVDIFDFGKTPDGRNYFVMELLEGKSLERLLVEEKALAPLRVVDIARQITSGLVAAHSRGIVHRDLKPDNVHLVRRGGRSDFIKILDFGIAKLTSGSGEIGRTQTGMVLGTPGYMAPEQAGGSNVDHRADIYALGVILYRMLAGRIPFGGENYAQILRRQLMEEASPLRSVRADVNERLDELILRMLNREPDGRPQTMAEVDDILGEIARDKLSTSAVWYTAPVAAASGGSGQAESQSLPTMAPEQVFGESARLLKATKSDAIDSMDPTSPPQRSLGRGGSTTALIAVAAVLIVAGGVLGVTTLNRPSPSVTGAAAPEPSAVPAPAPAPAPSPVSAPEAPVLPATGPFTVHIETDPAGATVLDAAQKKLAPTTPADITLAQEAPLTIRLPGYKDEKIEAKRGKEPVHLVLKKRVIEAAPAAPAALPKLHLRGGPPADETPSAAPPANAPEGNSVKLDD